MLQLDEPMYPYGRTLKELASSRELWSQWPTWPNKITLGRALVGTPLQLVLMALLPFTWWPLLNLAFWGASDWLDGYLAKHRGMGSVLGKILDPLADKLLIVFVMIGIVIQYCLMLSAALYSGVWLALDTMHLLVLASLAFVTVFTVVRDIRVTKMRLEEALPYGEFESARQPGRIKMVVQTISLVVFQVPFAAFIADEAWLVAVELFKVILIGGMFGFTFSSWLDYKRYHATR